MDYLEALMDKWCMPQWVFEELEQKRKIIELQKKQLGEDKKCYNLNDFVFKCTSCFTGFKLSENVSDVCMSHVNKVTYLINDDSYYSCCGYRPHKDSLEHPSSRGCVKGYHCPSIIDISQYNKIMKNESESEN